MKVTGVIPILLFLLVNGYVNCQNFDYSHLIDYEDNNITLTAVFQVQATYSSVTGDICANGVTNDTANLMCLEFVNVRFPVDVFPNLQATGTLTTDYSTLMFNSVAYSVNCSIGIDNCPGTQVSNCDSDGGLLAVKCVIDLSIPQPECYSQSQVMLSNPVNTTIPSGGYYLTGHPVTCNNGNFIPICSSVNIGPLERMAICIYTTGGQFQGGFNGAPSGVTVPPPTLRSNDTVSNQFSCSGYLNCSGNSVMGTCPNGYATVTCQKVCDEDYNATLFNNQTATIDGINYTVGIPQFCITGTYARICNDGTNGPGYGLTLCNSLGFAFGDLLPSNSSLAQTLYSGSPQGILYLDNFNCSSDENCEQNPGFVTNPQCYTGQLETALRCSRGIPCNGHSLYLHNNMTRIVNGREVVSGIPLHCVDGSFYGSLCNDGSEVQSALNFLCQLMGFDSNGITLPLDSSVYGRTPVGTAYYSSLSCPPNATSVDDCDALSSTNQQCWNGTMDLVLQCSRATNNTAPSTVTSSSSLSTLIPSPTTLSSSPSTLSHSSISTSSTTVISSTAPSTVSPSSSSSSPSASSSFPSASSSSPSISTSSTISSTSTSSALIIGLSVGIVVPVIIGVVVIIVILLVVFLIMKKRARGISEPVNYRKLSDSSEASTTDLA